MTVVSETTAMEDIFELGGKSFSSRLIVGTGKYETMDQMAEAIEASGAEIVTVATRRTSIADPSKPKLFDYLDPSSRIPPAATRPRMRSVMRASGARSGSPTGSSWR